MEGVLYLLGYYNDDNFYEHKKLFALLCIEKNIFQNVAISLFFSRIMQFLEMNYFYTTGQINSAKCFSGNRVNQIENVLHRLFNLLFPAL